MKAFITFILISTTCFSFGQIAVGPEIGMSILKVEDQQIGDDYQIGLNGGLAIEYAFSDALSIQTGIYYQQVKKGSSSKDTIPFDFFGLPDTAFSALGLDMNTYSSTISRHSLHYLQLPVVANFKYHNVNIFGGFYIGYLVGAKRKSLSQNTTPFVTTIDIGGMDPTGGLFSSFFPEPYEETFEETKDIGDIKRFDYGIKAGLGYSMEKLSVLGSFHYGIPKYRLITDGETTNNQFFQVSLRYMIPLFGEVSKSSIK